MEVHRLLTGCGCSVHNIPGKTYKIVMDLYNLAQTTAGRQELSGTADWLLPTVKHGGKTLHIAHFTNLKAVYKVLVMLELTNKNDVKSFKSIFDIMTRFLHPWHFMTNKEFSENPAQPSNLYLIKYWLIKTVLPFPACNKHI